VWNPSSRGPAEFFMNHSLPTSIGSAGSYHYFAVITACFTFLLIVAGALVTGNEAGLSVPDWPLSYGSLNPPWEGNIRYEHGHRLVAAFVGLLTIALAVWVWKKEPRRPVRKLGWIALGVVVAQGILGGVTVLWYLPAPISVLHACLAQTFFCLVVSLAWLSSSAWAQRVRDRSPGLPLNRLAMAAAGAIYLQLLLGAIFRHTQSGILPHLLGALLVTLLAGWLMARVFRSPRASSVLTGAATLLGVLLALQLLLGLASWLLRLATADAVQPQFPVVAVTTAHVAVGALILAASVILALQSWRVRSEEGRAESRTPATPVNP